MEIENLPSNAVGVLEMFSTSRTGIDIFTDQIIESVQSGNTNPLKLRIWIKSMEMIIERLNKETMPNQLREADKYPETKFQFSGAEISKGSTYTTYDYGHCGDIVWNRLEQMKKSIATQIKDREAFLRTLKAPLTLVDEDEIYTCNPPIKKETPGLKVSIK